MPDSCAVTSGTLRNWRLCASCPWRAGKRTGCRRKSISTACTRRWKTLPPSSGKSIWSPYSVRIPAVWRSDHVGRQYGGRKRVPLLERIHGWRTGAGLSQFSSVSIRLISLERPHSCWKPANGDWKEIGFMQSEFCKFCWGSLLEFCMGFKLHPVCSGCSFCVNGLRKTCRYPPSGKNGKRERSRKN